jgi:hypothetical protein
MVVCNCYWCACEGAFYESYEDENRMQMWNLKDL